MKQDDDLTPEELAAFARLPREMTPSRSLEERVVANLRDAGALRPRPRRRAGFAAVAAALLLLAGGFAIGRLTLASGDPGGGGQYLLLLYGAPAVAPGEMTSRVAEYATWAREERTAGRLVAAERLESAVPQVLGSTSAAPSPGQAPVGFFLIRAASADEARAVASRCPHLRHGGTVVVQAVAGR